MTTAKNRSGGPRRARSGRRRWWRVALIGLGLPVLLLASATGVVALWAFTILPRSLPSVTALESF